MSPWRCPAQNAPFMQMLVTGVAGSANTRSELALVFLADCFVFKICIATDSRRRLLVNETGDAEISITTNH